ncbi:MAG: hypothetical protein WAW73_09390 [Rhodoferax sp.]
MSITNGEFHKLAFGFLMGGMQPVSETRKVRLEMLIKSHGSIAALNEAIGWVRTDPKLAQIRNGNVRSGRSKPHQMGDAMAREIETTLSLGLGWMDTPPSYAELHGEEDPRTKVLLLMESMPPDQWPTAVRLLDALAQPAKATGTTGQ